MSEIFSLNEVMIDIETYSTKSNATILTIGAIKFNRNNLRKLKINELTFSSLNKFYIRVDLDSCKNKGFDIDPETVKWWNQQSVEAQHEVLKEPENRYNIEVCLLKLKEYIQGCDRIWSQGSFDSIILENAFYNCGISVPWKFWQIRDTRTVFDLCNVNLKKLKEDCNFIQHHALYDCYTQIIALNLSLKQLVET